MITIPNQSSIPKAFLEFEENGRMKPSPFYNRMVDVMEELMKFTVLTRGRSQLSGRQIFRARGKCRRTVAAGQSKLHLNTTQNATCFGFQRRLSQNIPRQAADRCSRL